MRADLWLVENGHYESRARAQAAIKAGLVKIDGKTIKKSSEAVNIAPNMVNNAPEAVNKTASVVAGQEHPWVSRGGIKLAHALKFFGVNPNGKICLDVGASTGGFCDVLLQNGAAKVYGVDVGSNQLHPKLHAHPKLVSMENQDARKLTAQDFDAPPNLIVCDASFISAIKVLEVSLKLAAPTAELVTLVKPQFEVGKKNIGKGGLVKTETLARQALTDVSAWIKTQGWQTVATTTSPITGGSGNTEYLLYARKV